ncbi:MAG TPA: DUF1549 domain-containing protein, partial [Bryobacteraceae bacterium]
MQTTGRFAKLVRSGLVLSALAIAQTPKPAPLNYDRDVRPILSENCFQCHGQDAKKRMAGLRLDRFETATANRKGHIALVPGNPEASLIYQRITAEPRSRRMPPVFANKNLTPEQVAILKRWIAEGGHYTKHWAFIPPVRPDVPDAHDPWLRQPIDGFVLARLRAEGLKPSPEAAPATWLRRVSLDLIGLPPSPAEIDAFTKEVEVRGEATYVAVVDRLLASPQYGERMAMDWLDVARYADTHGFNNDSERSMWRWRDWVIQSFNSNMPYDRFITEQLAGDLLPHPTLDQRIATGFGRNHVINSEGGIIEEEYRVQYVTDRVRTLGMAWMGLTLECAHCHDHKFDPITQRDHYRFYAFFNNVPEFGEDGRVANAVPIIPAPTAEQQAKMRTIEAAIAALKQQTKWTGKKVKLTIPHSDTILTIPCKEPRTPVSGQACTPGVNAQSAETVRMSKHDPITFSLWLNPTSADTDVALLSSMDYATNPASVSFGSGVELRLINGELEFRFSQRFPNYSVRVRSEGANLRPGEWRHLTLVYAGADKDAMRVSASWVRMFADGREIGTRVLNDDLAIPSAKDDKPASIKFRIGWDTRAQSPRYAGLLDEVGVWNRALREPEIRNVFESGALPHARKRYVAFTKNSAKLEKLRAELFAVRRQAPTVMVMQEMPAPRETHILIRG